MNTAYFWATVLVALYLWLCWFCLRRRRKPAVVNVQPAENDNSLLVAYASQSGNAEELAREYARLLQARHTVILLELNQVNSDLIKRTSMALFVVSTYGEGEPPDNALRFFQYMRRSPAGNSLSHLRFAVLALGDSQYRNFCGYGTTLEKQLTGNGASALFSAVTVDCMDREQLSLWQQQLHSHGLLDRQEGVLTSRAASFEQTMLIRQVCLNTGSPGEPVFLLSLARPAGLHWQAGDIVGIRPFNDAQIMPREYSIASLPEDDTLDLLVRQTRREDGSLGVGSGWLTQEAAIGSSITFRIRRNPSFHAPVAERPMILIGNGTGLAGLRSHLKARVLANARQNCLFFGERTSAHDYFFRDEILSWQEQGYLPELHSVFSRDQEEKRYVQDVLREQGALVRRWVEEGACIYICGSLQGMAGGVDLALTDILGEECLLQMKSGGSCARDVY